MLLKFLKETGGQIDFLTIRKFFAKMQEEKYAPSTIHKAFSVLRTFFAWCVEAEVMQTNPMKGFTVKSPRSLPRVPEVEEIEALLRACPDTFEGRRNKALVALLADSGLRISEALKLRIEDVNFSTRTIMVFGGKGGKDR
jgi:integrase/recombinase XerC